MEPFQISINDGSSVDILPEQAQALDLIHMENGLMHILHNQKKYVAEVLETDFATRVFVIRVNGSVFRLHIADKYERLIKSMGLTVGGAQKVNEVKAPMPGLVLSIQVEPGQEVKKGDPLLILEAMKMENVIKCSGDAVVKAVHVTKGVPVEKGALLISFESGG